MASYKIFLIVLNLLDFLIVISLFSYFLYLTFIKRKIESSGQVIFEIDMANKRIRINNNIKMISLTFPEFLIRSPMADGSWQNLENFNNFFSKDSVILLKDALEANYNNSLSFNLSLKLANQYKKRLALNLLIENSESTTLIATLDWKEITYFYKNKFKRISQNKNYLFEHLKINATLLSIDIKYLENIDYIVEEIAKLIPTNKCKKIVVIQDDNNIYLCLEDYAKLENYKKKFQETILDNINKLFRCVNFAVILNENIFEDLNLEKLNTIINYIQYKMTTEKKLNFESIDKTIYENPDFIKFSQQYKKFCTLIEENKLTIMTKEVKTINGSHSTNFKLIKPAFIERNDQIYYEKNMLHSDVAFDLGFQFYKNTTKYDLQNSLLVLSDFFFSKLNDNYIKNISLNSPTLTQIVKINNPNNLYNLQRKFNSLNNRDVKLGIKVIILNDELINFIKKTNLTYIVIDKILSNKLNNFKIMLYINIIIEIAKQNNASIIFEGLDYTSYRNVLKNKYSKILYTN
ncbi:MHO_4530 family protein [Metamycoplasma buccale]|uniref:MHO_4530 family protein n=1 Tax=Metamycoplasma buccale TaxID=55602 RepID=UPI00398F8B8A